jgi:hypothetical protein
MVSAIQTVTQQHSHSGASPSNGSLAALKLRANGGDIHSSRLSRPPQLSGAFERRGYSHREVTPAIGEEFGRNIDLAALLEDEESDNDEELWRELAALGEWSVDRCIA